jgi:hypothetical protein
VFKMFELLPARRRHMGGSFSGVESQDSFRPAVRRASSPSVTLLDSALGISATEGVSPHSPRAVQNVQNPPWPLAFWSIEDRDGFASRYAQAREALMDHWSEEIVVIADDQTAEPNDRRVRVDTRKWLMSKLAYRRYGDKLIHSGDADNPIRVMHEAARISDLSPVELEALDLFTRARLTVIDVETEGGRIGGVAVSK